MHAVCVEASEFCRLLLPILDQMAWALTWANRILAASWQSEFDLRCCGQKEKDRESAWKCSKMMYNVHQWYKVMWVMSTLWHELVHKFMFAHLQHWQDCATFGSGPWCWTTWPRASWQRDMDLYIHIYPARTCGFVITIYRNDMFFPLHHDIVRLLWYPESFLSFWILPAFQSTALSQCSQRQRTGLQRRTDTEARCIFSVAKLWFQW